MTQGRRTFHRVEELFHRAATLSPAERAVFLAAECAGRPGVRAEVEKLLAQDARGTAALLAPALSRTGQSPSAAARLDPGAAIGPYRVVERVGEGGMGEVYRAEQLRPLRRQVALKLVKAGMDTRQVLVRFELERQALARMEHPAIARVFDAGVTPAGRPFFAMELVEGEPITDFCDRRRVDVAARLRLFVRVCQAVQHAHQRGIVHRDLKPSNLLTREREGEIEVKVIDFGIAKALGEDLAAEPTAATRLDQVLGTPAYMSPEQAGAGHGGVDTRADVYSLGVVLYELLIGVVPFAAEERSAVSLEELRRRIRDEDAPRPSTRLERLGAEGVAIAAARSTSLGALKRQLRVDLDWIAGRALEKDPARRYPSVSELAADVERHLRHEPVTAGPPGATYRIGKFVRRHRVAVAAGTTVTGALTAGATLALVGMVRAVRAREEARAEAIKAAREARTARQVSNFLVGLFEASRPGEKRPAEISAQELLDRGAATVRRELADEPLVQARLLQTLGFINDHLGRHETAAELLEAALALHDTEPTGVNCDRAATLQRLGSVYHSLGRLADGEQLLRTAVTLQEEELGPDHLDLTPSLAMLAAVLRSRAAYPEARLLLERALSIREAHLGPDHVDVGRGLGLLGDLLAEIGEGREALPQLERAARIAETHLGRSHYQTGMRLHQLANAQYAVGDLAGALDRYRGALEVFERVLAPDHPELAALLQNLALVHKDRAELEEARRLLLRSLAIKESVFGPDAAPTAYALYNLGSVLADLGENAIARNRLERALAVFETRLGADHPNVSYPLTTLGDLLCRDGRGAEALPLYERALALRLRSFGEDHAHVALSRAVLGRTLIAVGRIEEARPLLAAALATMERRLDPGHPYLETARRGWAELTSADAATGKAEAHGA